MPMPEISVIIPTRNRVDLLGRMLCSLWRQSLEHERFEVIVVDDGCTDETQELLATLSPALPLRSLRQAPSGISAAKNLGLFAARSPLVLFLDDDDAAHHRLLETHLRFHQAHPAVEAALLGHTELEPSVARCPLMQHVTQDGSQLFSYSTLPPGTALDYRHFWGGRTSCKRQLLIEGGVFNPDFTFGCEDIELGWRLRQRGLHVIYEPDARTKMLRSLSFDDFCKRSTRQGRAQWRFQRLHREPEVVTYCEVEAALAAWQQEGAQFDTTIAEARRLHETAVALMERDEAPDHDLTVQLNAAYRHAFFMCRARGLVEARQEEAAAN